MKPQKKLSIGNHFNVILSHWQEYLRLESNKKFLEDWKKRKASNKK